VLAGAVAASPFESRAESGKRRIGVLLGNSEKDSQALAGMSELRKGLQALGWVEGRNIEIVLRWGRSDIDRMQDLARELVGLKPDVIFASTTPGVAALHRETKSLPIVFVVVSDPVGSGFVQSLPHPGGNITGFINIEASLGGKWAELLKEVFPEVLHAAILFNPETAPYFAYYVQPFEAAARSLGFEPLVSPVRSNAEIESVIGAVAPKPRSSLVMCPDVFVNTKERRDLITSLAARYRMPGIYPYAYMVPGGGL